MLDLEEPRAHFAWEDASRGKSREDRHRAPRGLPAPHPPSSSRSTTCAWALTDTACSCAGSSAVGCKPMGDGGARDDARGTGSCVRRPGAFDAQAASPVPHRDRGATPFESKCRRNPSALARQPRASGASGGRAVSYQAGQIKWRDRTSAQSSGAWLRHTPSRVSERDAVARPGLRRDHSRFS